jgi:hypothetical protein
VAAHELEAAPVVDFDRGGLRAPGSAAEREPFDPHIDEAQDLAAVAVELERGGLAKPGADPVEGRGQRRHRIADERQALADHDALPHASAHADPIAGTGLIDGGLEIDVGSATLGVNNVLSAELPARSEGGAEQAAEAEH